MLLVERRHKLVDEVSRRGFIGLTELAAEMKVSESTIRRDLEQLEHSGVIRRTHGGAYYAGEGLAVMPAFEDRTATALDEKRDIARRVASLIGDGEAVLLDGGTTTYEVARQLVGRSLQVVTNSLPIANLFAASRQVDLILIGGYVYPKTGVALGPLSNRMLADIHVRRTIMSVGGITEKGLFNSNMLLVETERAMMRAAEEVIVVADHTKFGRQALADLCPLSEIDRLVVDAGIPSEWPSRVKEAGVELLVADRAANDTPARSARREAAP